MNLHFVDLLGFMHVLFSQFKPVQDAGVALESMVLFKKACLFQKGMARSDITVLIKIIWYPYVIALVWGHGYFPEHI